MRAFIQCDKQNLPINPNVFNAFDGLRTMGFECIFFQTYEDLIELRHSKSEIIVGGIYMIRRRLQDFGISCDEINYPEELRSYLGRRIWNSKIEYIRDHPDAWPVFIKSVEGKRLTGKVISSIKDLVGCGCHGDNYDVLCSDPVNFKAEWRVFVRYGKILDIRPYRVEDYSLHYDLNIIEKAVQDYSTAPNAYGIDFGITDDEKTLLIEVNDGYALGCYGLYAKFLITRWSELVNIPDEFWYL